MTATHHRVAKDNHHPRRSRLDQDTNDVNIITCTSFSANNNRRRSRKGFITEHNKNQSNDYVNTRKKFVAASIVTTTTTTTSALQRISSLISLVVILSLPWVTDAFISLPSVRSTIKRPAATATSRRGGADLVNHRSLPFSRSKKSSPQQTTLRYYYYISSSSPQYSTVTTSITSLALMSKESSFISAMYDTTNNNKRICFSLYSSNSDNDDSINDRPSSDDEEWKSLLAALRMYKAAYGNLKVPLRFVVPALAPWPEKAWNIKLGHRVAAIRATGKYINSEKRRKILDDMGFVWQSRAFKEKNNKGLSFDQIYDALVTYRNVIQGGKSKLNIPSNFVVPDREPWPESVRGLPLGAKVSSLRSKSFLAANPTTKEKLKAIGFQFDGKVAANDARFQLVYDALKRYKEIYGELLVPQPFVVPERSKEWPEPTWGLRLGARVNAIRSQGTFVSNNPERKQLLDDLGFVWNPSEKGSRRGRKRKEEKEAVDAMERAAEEKFEYSNSETTSDSMDMAFDAFLEESFQFDKDDEIEEGSDSPKWGLETGRRMEEAAQLAEEEAQAVDEYRPPKDLAQSLQEATQRAIDVGVIKKIPEEDRFVKGKRENDIAWFNDDFGGEFVFDDVVEALSVYKSIYGDVNLTDYTFVIPNQSDEDYPELDGSGDRFRDDDATSRAAAAIARFEQQQLSEADSMFGDMEGSETVATREKVATAEKEVIPGEWPEHLGGMVLGNIVQRIRDGSLEVKHLPERKAKLDELGFDWGDPARFIDFPFEKAMCAMYAYYQIRGDMFVPEDFVILDEEPWPQALAGYEIGKAVRRIRELQFFFEEYHIEKVSLLRMVEFVWFPMMALPLDPDAPPLTLEQQKLRHWPSPNPYQFPNEFCDFELNEKIRNVTEEMEDIFEYWEVTKDAWYTLGRRDQAFRLKKCGYPEMAADHEERYGPGLYTRLNETFNEVEGDLKGKSDEELVALREKLEYFRDELEPVLPHGKHAEIGRDLGIHVMKVFEGIEDYIYDLSTENEVRPLPEKGDPEWPSGSQVLRGLLEEVERYCEYVRGLTEENNFQHPDGKFEPGPISPYRFADGSTDLFEFLGLDQDGEKV